MPKAVLLGPVIFGLTGALVGVSAGMLFFPDPEERAHVPIDDSLPLAGGGAFLGGLVGWGVKWAYETRPRVRAAIEVTAVTVLCGSIAAPAGWIVGESLADRIPGAGMGWGALFGLAAGLLLGTSRAARSPGNPSNQV
jgi:drug/metabolite transporter (DMT)-like permease